MVSLSVNVYRGKVVESKHQVISLIKDTDGNVLLSTNKDNGLISLIPFLALIGWTGAAYGSALNIAEN